VRLRPAPPRLDVDELRELHAAAQILERLALERARPFDAGAIADLRAANARLGEVTGQAAKALVADHQVRGLLTEHCHDRRLLALLAEVRFALLPFRRLAMESPVAVLARTDEHDEIIDLVERGDAAAAAGRLGDSGARELDGLLALLEPAPPRMPALSS
jgi:DNA-binding GntR family transcriptional regulator